VLRKESESIIFRRACPIEDVIRADSGTTRRYVDLKAGLYADPSSYRSIGSFIKPMITSISSRDSNQKRT